MKKILYSTLIAAASLGVLTSCEDMMNPKSGGYLYDEDLTLNSPNDSLYSIAGLLTKVQQLGDRYVLFGELRGDLVTVSPEANIELKNLSEFNAQENDTFLRRTDFYAVINHCNWIIKKMDPTVTKNNEAVLADEYAAAVFYRAWTYLQLGLAYGNVEWVTEPVLSLEDAEKQYEMIGLDELVKRLIADVEPYAAELRPNFGDIDGTDARKFFLVPSVFLGDLYLYDGQYDRAAQMYWNAINDYRLNIGDACIQFYNGNSQRLQLGSTLFKGNYINEVISAIPYSTSANAYHPQLVNLTYGFTPSIKPAGWWVNDMADRNYYFGNKTYIAGTYSCAEQGGDLRAGVRFADDRVAAGGAVGYYSNEQGSEQSMIIDKFGYNAHVFSEATLPDGISHLPMGVTSLALARASHVYLRFAEAVNRLGKPTLAYAVVRYGLNALTIADATKVDPAELETGQPWLVWNEAFLDGNIGTAQRGRGYGIAYPESVQEDIPGNLDAGQQMLWIEDVIADELAAETAFEGNRFFDLVRIARHRGDDSWFAGRVSRRFADPAAAMTLLSSRTNWFIH